jgi:hypothetical protein
MVGEVISAEPRHLTCLTGTGILGKKPPASQRSHGDVLVSVWYQKAD